jgi:hypothetical protein
VIVLRVTAVSYGYINMHEEMKPVVILLRVTAMFHRYVKHRDLLINILMVVELIMINIVQLIVPANVMPGTADAETHAHVSIYWNPMVACFLGIGFRVS